jgi:uncharacterized protein (TIGR03435 family)
MSTPRSLSALNRTASALRCVVLLSALPRRLLLLAAVSIPLAGPASVELLLGPRLQAQSPAGVASAPAVFEAASIKPHKNLDDGQETNLLPGGRYTGVNASVRKLIRLAFGVEEGQILGAPGWIDSEHYDIDARTGETTTLEPPEFQRLLLALLEDRFHLKFHRETRERPVYWLVVQKNGPKLKPHGQAEGAMSDNSNGTKTVMKATKMSMQSLAGALSRQTGQTVEDHTGVAGDFDIELEWDSNQTPDSTGPSIFTAVQEQLGLRLNPAKGQVEAIVVDHVERPSEN